MNSNDIESELLQLGANWPVGSVAEEVSRRLETLPVSEIVKAKSHRLQWTLAGSILILFIGLSIVWMTAFVTPLSVDAQVKEAIRNASTAEIVVEHMNPQGKSATTHIWYSKERGVRFESPGWIYVDDGKHRWAWNPVSNEAEKIVERRASLDGINEITKALQLGNIRAEWRQSRLAERDMNIGGKRCQAHLIDPGPDFTTSFDNGATQTRLRYILWFDPQRRIMRNDCQKLANEKWETISQVSFEYDIEIAADKFSVQFPPTSKIVDADRLWSNRFPLEKALATVVSGGLQFAVHEVTRCESDMFYIVSSVRGTTEHLKQYPPVPRPFNLRVTLLDVAEQGPGAGISHVNQLCKTAILSNPQEVGVDYLYWLAIPRRPYWMKDGVRTDSDYPSQLEIVPGQIKIPLSARYSGRLINQWGEKTEVVVDLSQAQQFSSLAEVVKRCLQDASLEQDGLVLFGAAKDGQLQRMISTGVMETDYTKAIREQIKWLNSQDEVKNGQLVSAALDWIGIPVRLPHRIEGQVVDTDNKPVANAHVTVQIRRFKNGTEIDDPDLPTPWKTLTDEQGHYQFDTDEQLLDSVDMLCITTEVKGFPKLDATDYERQVASGTLPVQKLRAWRTIRGRILDPQGNSATQTKIRIWTNTSDLKGLWDSDRFSVDENGAFSVVIPGDGKALIEIFPKGFAPQVQYLSDGDIDLGAVHLESGTSVHGRVIDREGNGIAGAVVVIQDQDVKHLFKMFQCPCCDGAKTDKNGEFTIPPFYGKCKVYVTDEAKEYDTGLSVYGTQPNSIPPQMVDLTGREKTKEINFRKDK